MLKRLRMVRWKSFEDAELAVGPFTLLVGANASGKSNVREALRFLHAVGRGYDLPEIFGGKWSEGERQWSGIRGGVREAAFRGATSFALQAHVELRANSTLLYEARYEMEVRTASSPPRVIRESLETLSPAPRSVYDAYLTTNVSGQEMVLVNAPEGTPAMFRRASGDRPALFSFDPSASSDRSSDVSDLLIALAWMRFIDPSPEAMRQPSMPGQTVLSDRGENLSSVLQSLCSRDETKAEIIHWLRALTPMDVTDLKFDVDRRGQVLLLLVEKDGTEISADSASEGTLRFLGLLAALMSPESGLYFFEEIENGLHPSRLRLLLDLIQERTSHGRIRVVATTHSPALLALLPDELLEYASVVVRLEDERSSRIVRLLDVPDAERVLRDHDRGELFASGWFENMVEFGESKKLTQKKSGTSE